MIDLDAMSVTELKALAYDQIAAIEQCRANLDAIQRRLAQLGQAATADEAQRQREGDEG